MKAKAHKMKINFDFSTEDWLALQDHYLSYSKTFKLYKAMAMVTGPIVFLLVILYQLIKGESDYLLIIFLGIASIGWVVFYPRRFKSTTIKRSRKMFEEGNNSGLIGPHEIVLSENEISYKEPGSESTTRWEYIVRYSEDENHIILFMTSLSAIVIPKDKAITDTEKERVFEFIRNKVNKTA
ncbi:MAG TPA: YcxB family protein [Anaerolineae bacterium]|nr:YcxB family protein [Anaerolineae bacterium]